MSLPKEIEESLDVAYGKCVSGEDSRGIVLVFLVKAVCLTLLEMMRILRAPSQGSDA